MKKEKKIFVMGKVYDMTKQDIESLVQKDLDIYVGEDKVKFKFHTLGNIVAMFFYRNVNYAVLGADPEKDMIDADAFMITGHSCNGFFMPEPFPTIPGGYSYSMLQTDFLNAYRESAKILGASRIKDSWLEITPNVIILRVQLR